MELAKTDPEVDLSGEGPAFTPRAYLEEEGDERLVELLEPGQTEQKRREASSKVVEDPSNPPAKPNQETARV